MAEILIGNIRGPKGDTGNGLTIKDFYDTMDELPSNPEVGDAYGVKNADGDYEIHIYSPSNGWVNNGALAPDINKQAPNYEEAKTLETLTSGEKISLAFGKIKKAITDLIAHITNKSNPHNVTADQVGAVALGDNIVTGKHGDSSVDGGVRFGIRYTEEGIPMVGMGTERGANSLILTSGCDYTDAEHESELGERCYYFPVSVEESNASFPVALKISNADGKLYIKRSSNGKKHYAKNEIIPMNEHEVIHTGNISTYSSLPVEVKNYIGNGKFGEENARMFEFSFRPKLIHISGYGLGGGNYTLTVPWGFPFAHIVVQNGSSFAVMECLFDYDDATNTVGIYNNTSAEAGFNTNGKDYTITAMF